MATAVDLGAYEGGCGKDTFPNLCIHPGYKAAVGARLALGARNIALGETGSYYSGPVFASAAVVTSHAAGVGGRLAVHFHSAGEDGIAVREKTGFEVGVGPPGNETWTTALVVSFTKSSVTLAPAATLATAVRYLWSQTPCTHPHGMIGNCSVYAAKEGLPTTPFTHRL